MRICPECGHADHPMWRPRASRPFCEYTKAETLEYNDPELFAKVKEAAPEPFFDGHFVYHISRTGLNAERIEKELYDYMKWGQEPQEKVDHSAMAPHPRLAEYMTNTAVEPDVELHDTEFTNYSSKKENE